MSHQPHAVRDRPPQPGAYIALAVLSLGVATYAIGAYAPRMNPLALVISVLQASPANRHAP